MWRILSQISITKTLRFNLRYFGFKKTLSLPVIVSRSVILKQLNGTVTIVSPIKLGMIKIGFESVGLFDRRISKGIWESDSDGKVTFCGTAYFGTGSKISICGGELTFGKNFCITANSKIICKEKIYFGDNCLISWDCLFMDTDFHKILSYNGVVTNKNKPIKVGNHVWFGCQCMVLKGSDIANNSIIAAGSIVKNHLKQNNTIYCGIPATLSKQNVFWRE